MYDFLIMVDFEATCDDGVNPLVTKENQEIIEFPWVVLEVSTTQILDKRQVFVKPEWTTELTPFCTNLTGISNEQLESAGPLRDAVQQFDNYVYNGFVAVGKSFCIVTDGPWDLKYCLRSEAAAKGIKLSPHYTRFFDLRNEFQKRYNNVHISGLKAMVEYLGLTMEGRHHSGIDDSLTICKIVTRLINDGHRFETAEVIPDNFVPEDYKDFSKSRNERQVQRQSTYDRSLPESVVRLRGLPWQTTESDIIDFFSPLVIVPSGVHFTRNHQGRPNGEAFVEFGSEDDAQKSLDRHKQHLGNRYIEVYKINRKEMDSFSRAVVHTFAIGYSNSVDMRYRGVLRLRGLPFTATDDEIQDFFRGYSIAPDGIHIQIGLDGRPTGDAFVEFASEEQADQALQVRHKGVMRNRYIELFPSSRGDLFNTLGSNFGGGMGSGSGAEMNLYGGSGFGQASASAIRGGNITLGMGGIFDGVDGSDNDSCVRMRGLPFRATPRDILHFFKGLNVIPGGIHFVFNDSNRPTGEAYVEFATSNDATLAMSRHRQNIGGRYIELYRSSRSEMILDVNSNSGSEFGGGVGGVDPSMLFLMPSLNQGLNMHQMPNVGFDPRGINMGGVLPNNLNISTPGFGGGMGGMGLGLGGMGLGNVGNMGLGLGNINELGMGGPHGHGHIDKSGTVRMRGLPFTATPDDIMDFFCDYDIIPHSISMGVTHGGRPNGEAWLQFVSQQEAARAVNEKNRGHMGTRYIELHAVNF